MVTLLVAICTALGTFATLWGTIIYPRAKEKKKLEAEAGKRQAERDEDVDGIVSVSGEVVTPRLAVRVKAVENEMRKVTAGQSLLEQRMDEANGTGRATKQTVEEIRGLVLELASAELAKKTDLDAAARKVASEAVGRQVEVLQALAEHTTEQ